MTFAEIIERIGNERHRQEELKRAGRFAKTCADEQSDADRLVILTEEVGEIARAIHDGDQANLVEEVLQVAAVAVAWLEAKDANELPAL